MRDKILDNIKSESKDNKKNRIRTSFDDYESKTFKVGVPKGNAKKDARTAAPLVAAGTQEALKASMFAFGRTVKTQIEREMPHTSDAIGGIIELKDGLTDQISNTKKNILDTTKAVKQAAKSQLPRIESLLPTPLYKKLDKFLTTQEDTKSATLSKEEQRQQATTDLLTNVFKEQDKIRHQDEARKVFEGNAQRALETKRHHDSTILADQSRKELVYQSRFLNSVLTPYLKKSLELKYMHLFASQDTLGALQTLVGVVENKLEDIKLNTSLPDIQKQKRLESLKGEMRKKSSEYVMSKFNNKFTKKILTNIEDAVTGKINDALENMKMMADMVVTAGDMMNMGIDDIDMDPESEDLDDDQKAALKAFNAKKNAIKGVGGLGGKIAGSLLANKYGRKAIKKISPKMQKIDKYMTNAPQKLALEAKYRRENPTEAKFKGDTTKEKFQNAIKDPKSFFSTFGEKLLNAFSSVVPEFNQKNLKFVNTTNRGDTKEPTNFDVGTRTSIVEIIPGYLSKILKEITTISTGKPAEELVFDPNSVKRFISASEFKKNLKTEVYGEQGYRSERIEYYVNQFKDDLKSSDDFDKVKQDVKLLFTNFATEFKGLKATHIELFKEIIQASQDQIKDLTSKFPGLFRNIKNLKAVCMYIVGITTDTDGNINKEGLDTCNILITHILNTFDAESPIEAIQERINAGEARFLSDLNIISNDPNYSDEFKFNTDTFTDWGMSQKEDESSQQKKSRKSKSDRLPLGSSSSKSRTNISSPQSAVNVTSPELAELLASQTDTFTDINKTISDYWVETNVTLLDIHKELKEKLDLTETNVILLDIQKVIESCCKNQQTVINAPESSQVVVQASSQSDFKDLYEDIATKQLETLISIEAKIAAIGEKFGIKGLLTGITERVRDFAKSTGTKLGNLSRNIGTMVGGLISGVGSVASGAASGVWNATKGVGNFASKIGSNILNVGKDLGSAIKLGFSKYIDIFLKDQVDPENPLLTAQTQKDGVIHKGKPLESSRDIDSVVWSQDGNQIITQEHLAIGLVDINNKPISNKLKSLTGLLGRGLGVVGKTLKAVGLDLPMKILGKAKSIGKSVLDIGKKVLEGFKPPYIDIYRKDKIDPSQVLLTAQAQQDGVWFADQTLVKKSSEIDQPVLDKDGNIIITEEDIKIGLVDIKGRPINRKLLESAALGLGGILKKAMIDAPSWIGKKVVAGIKGALNFLQGVKQSIKDYYIDVYRKDQLIPGKPLLTIRQQEEGVFFGDGKQVKTSRDIKEPVLDKDGKTIITEDDLKAGLVDVNGKDISGTLANKIGFKVGQGLRALGKGLKALAIDLPLKALKSLGTYISGIFNDPKNIINSNKVTKDVILEHVEAHLLKILNHIQKECIMVKPCPKGEIREGSYEDYFRDKAARQKDKKEKSSTGLDEKSLKKLLKGLQPKEQSLIGGIMDEALGTSVGAGIAAAAGATLVAIKKGLSTVGGAIKGGVQKIFGKGTTTAITSGADDVAKATTKAVTKTIASSADNVATAAAKGTTGIFGKIGGFLSGGFKAIGRVFGKLGGLLKSPKKLIAMLIGGGVLAYLWPSKKKTDPKDPGYDPTHPGDQEIKDSQRDESSQGKAEAYGADDKTPMGKIQEGWSDETAREDLIMKSAGGSTLRSAAEATAAVTSIASLKAVQGMKGVGSVATGITTQAGKASTAITGLAAKVVSKINILFKALSKKVPFLAKILANPSVAKVIATTAPKIAAAGGRIATWAAGSSTGPFIIALMVGLAAYDAIQGWRKADEIMGVPKGTLSFFDKVRVSLASVISGLAAGLIPKSWLARKLGVSPDPYLQEKENELKQEEQQEAKNKFSTDSSTIATPGSSGSSELTDEDDQAEKLSQAEAKTSGAESFGKFIGNLLTLPYRATLAVGRFVGKVAKTVLKYTVGLPFVLAWRAIKRATSYAKYNNEELRVFIKAHFWKLKAQLPEVISKYITKESIKKITDTVSEDKYDILRKNMDNWKDLLKEMKSTIADCYKNPDGVMDVTPGTIKPNERSKVAAAYALSVTILNEIYTPKDLVSHLGIGLVEPKETPDKDKSKVEITSKSAYDAKGNLISKDDDSGLDEAERLAAEEANKNKANGLFEWAGKLTTLPSRIVVGVLKFGINYTKGVFKGVAKGIGKIWKSLTTTNYPGMDDDEFKTYLPGLIFKVRANVPDTIGKHINKFLVKLLLQAITSEHYETLKQNAYDFKELIKEMNKYMPDTYTDADKIMEVTPGTTLSPVERNKVLAAYALSSTIFKGVMETKDIANKIGIKIMKPLSKTEKESLQQIVKAGGPGAAAAQKKLDEDAEAAAAIAQLEKEAEAEAKKNAASGAFNWFGKVAAFVITAPIKLAVGAVKAVGGFFSGIWKGIKALGSGLASIFTVDYLALTDEELPAHITKCYYKVKANVPPDVGQYMTKYTLDSLGKKVEGNQGQIRENLNELKNLIDALPESMEEVYSDAEAFMEVEPGQTISPKEKHKVAAAHAISATIFRDILSVKEVGNIIGVNINKAPMAQEERAKLEEMVKKGGAQGEWAKKKLDEEDARLSEIDKEAEEEAKKNESSGKFSWFKKFLNYSPAGLAVRSVVGVVKGAVDFAKGFFTGVKDFLSGIFSGPDYTNEEKFPPEEIDKLIFSRFYSLKKDHLPLKVGIYINQSRIKNLLAGITDNDVKQIRRNLCDWDDLIDDWEDIADDLDENLASLVEIPKESLTGTNVYIAIAAVAISSTIFKDVKTANQIALSLGIRGVQSTGPSAKTQELQNKKDAAAAKQAKSSSSTTETKDASVNDVEKEAEKTAQENENNGKFSWFKAINKLFGITEVTNVLDKVNNVLKSVNKGILGIGKGILNLFRSKDTIAIEETPDEEFQPLIVSYFLKLKTEIPLLIGKSLTIGIAQSLASSINKSFYPKIRSNMKDWDDLIDDMKDKVEDQLKYCENLIGVDFKTLQGYKRIYCILGFFIYNTIFKDTLEIKELMTKLHVISATLPVQTKETSNVPQVKPSSAFFTPESNKPTSSSNVTPEKQEEEKAQESEKKVEEEANKEAQKNEQKYESIFAKIFKRLKENVETNFNRKRILPGFINKLLLKRQLNKCTWILKRSLPRMFRSILNSNLIQAIGKSIQDKDKLEILNKNMTDLKKMMSDITQIAQEGLKDADAIMGFDEGTLQDKDKLKVAGAFILSRTLFKDIFEAKEIATRFMGIKDPNTQKEKSTDETKDKKSGFGIISKFTIGFKMFGNMFTKIGKFFTDSIKKSVELVEKTVKSTKSVFEVVSDLFDDKAEKRKKDADAKVQEIFNMTDRQLALRDYNRLTAEGFFKGDIVKSELYLANLRNDEYTIERKTKVDKDGYNVADIIVKWDCEDPDQTPAAKEARKIKHEQDIKAQLERNQVSATSTSSSSSFDLGRTIDASGMATDAFATDSSTIVTPSGAIPTSRPTLNTGGVSTQGVNVPGGSSQSVGVPGGQHFDLPKGGSGGGKQISPGAIGRIAQELGVEPELLHAIYMVESSGKGFLPDGRPRILFEGHVFWKQLKKFGIDPSALVRQNSGLRDILYSSWGERGNAYKLDQYERLKKAMAIHPEAALNSASYGSFQILGTNAKGMGYSNSKEMIDAISAGPDQELDALKRFLIMSKLVGAMKKRDFNAIARGYNGSGYAQHNYHGKMASYYNQLKAKKTDYTATAAEQTAKDVPNETSDTGTQPTIDNTTTTPSASSTSGGETTSTPQVTTEGVNVPGGSSQSVSTPGSADTSMSSTESTTASATGTTEGSTEGGTEGQQPGGEAGGVSENVQENIKTLQELGVKSTTSLGGGGFTSVGKVRPDLLGKFTAAVKEFKAAYPNKGLSITSAFRTAQDQASLQGTKGAAKVGSSPHQQGRAFDIGNEAGGGVKSKGYGVGSVADLFEPFANKYGLTRLVPPYRGRKVPHEEQHFEIPKDGKTYTADTTQTPETTGQDGAPTSVGLSGPGGIGGNEAESVPGGLPPALANSPLGTAMQKMGGAGGLLGSIGGKVGGFVKGITDTVSSIGNIFGGGSSGSSSGVVAEIPSAGALPTPTPSSTGGSSYENSPAIETSPTVATTNAATAMSTSADSMNTASSAMNQTAEVTAAAATTPDPSADKLTQILEAMKNIGTLLESVLKPGMLDELNQNVAMIANKEDTKEASNTGSSLQSPNKSTPVIGGSRHTDTSGKPNQSLDLGIQRK
jgi:hypothetical protein